MFANQTVPKLEMFCFNKIRASVLQDLTYRLTVWPDLVPGWQHGNLLLTVQHISKASHQIATVSAIHGNVESLGFQKTTSPTWF
jgi:hypothetical protein